MILIELKDLWQSNLRLKAESLMTELEKVQGATEIFMRYKEDPLKFQSPGMKSFSL